LPAALVAVISAPQENAIVGGAVQVTGSASGAGVQGYQLAYGAGFDPPQWIPIVESNVPVLHGILGTWNTAGLADGLYALRLTVVGLPGMKKEAVVHVMADNQAPVVRIVAPKAGETPPAGKPIAISAQAEDNLGVAHVEFYIDGGLVATLTAQPFTWTWKEPTAGAHKVQARAYDLAGNPARSEEIAFTITGRLETAATSARPNLRRPLISLRRQASQPLQRLRAARK